MTLAQALCAVFVCAALVSSFTKHRLATSVALFGASGFSSVAWPGQDGYLSFILAVSGICFAIAARNR